MEVVFGLALVVGAVYWWKTMRDRDPHRGRGGDNISIRVHTSTSRHPTSEYDTDAVSIEDPSDGVVLNPNGRLPIHIHGLSSSDVHGVIESFRRHDSPRTVREDLGLLIAQHNAQSPEVEQFLAEVHKDYDSRLKAELQREPGYEDWPAGDRDDFVQEAREAAADDLPICTEYADIALLMNDRPADETADDAVTQRFGSDAEGLRAYLRMCGRKKPIEANDREERKPLERLVENGLAIRGSDMPLETLLEHLRMKDIQRILGDDAPKKFTRKADAIEFAAQIPDMRDRVAEEIPLRSIYQAVDPPGDVEAASRAFAFASEYAGLIVTTLITEEQTHRQSDGKRFEVLGDECRLCEHHQDKEITRAAKKARPPHHVGCMCDLQPIEF